MSDKKAKGPRGFKRTKTQVTIRIEDSILEKLRKSARSSGTEVTAMIEEAVVREIERRQKEPPVTGQVRLLVSRAKPAEQRAVKRLLAYLRLPDTALSATDRVLRPAFLKVLEGCEKSPAFEKALASFGVMPAPETPQ